MSPMDQEILNLKIEGKSLREIGKALGISHVAVIKRLKRLPIKNKVVTSKDPSYTPGESTNPLDSPPREGHEGQKRISREEAPGRGDLFWMIREFLEERGIEVYRIKAGPEAYQIEHGDQVIRFYVQRIFKGNRTNGEKR